MAENEARKLLMGSVAEMDFWRPEESDEVQRGTLVRLHGIGKSDYINLPRDDLRELIPWVLNNAPDVRRLIRYRLQNILDKTAEEDNA